MSADGSVAVVTTGKYDPATAGYPSTQLTVIDTATGKQVGVTFTLAGYVSPGFRSTAVSADGSRAAFVANGSVTILDTATGKQVGGSLIFADPGAPAGVRWCSAPKVLAPS